MASAKGNIVDVRTSREFALLARLCRAAFAGADDARFVRSRPIDWPLFLALARFHRVEGVVLRGLKSRTDVQVLVPPAIAREIAGDASRITAINLRMTEECRILADRFDVAGIPLLFVKGLTLGVLAYGDIATKASVDIDLLVEEQRLADAVTVLEAEGYDRVQPARAMTAEKLAAWHALRKESSWRKRGSSLQVDLHTRLADNPRMIPGIGIASPRQMVQLAPGIALPTLAPEPLFAYLCVHGASSAWFRLKWICDLAALVEHSALPIHSLCENARRQGAGRAAAQALLLADRLFGTLDAAPRVRAALNRGPANRLLARIAFNQLAGRHEPSEPTGRLLGTAAIHYSQLLLKPGIGFAASELSRQARAALSRS